MCAKTNGQGTADGSWTRRSYAHKEKRIKEWQETNTIPDTLRPQSDHFYIFPLAG